MNASTLLKGSDLETKEIIRLHDDEEFSPEDIALELGVDIEEVRLVLDNHSPAFRAETVGPDLVVKGELSEHFHRRILKKMIDLALNGTNETAVVKALIYLNEEACGRNKERVERIKDNRIAAQTTGLMAREVLMERFAKARAAVMAAKGQKELSTTTVDIS